MINSNIEYYIKINKNYLSKPLVNNIREELKEKDNLFTRHVYSRRNEETNELFYFSEQDDLWVYADEIAASKDISRCVWNSIAEYLEFINFPWFMEWYGYTPIRFNKYPAGSRMELHCDHIHSAFDGERKGVPVLSVLAGLSDPDEYTGGELVFFGNKKVELNKGDLMIFPSNFLYPHIVTPVLSGTRYSFVSWVW